MAGLMRQKPRVLFFHATWHEPSQQMASVVAALAAQHPSLAFESVDAEASPELGEAHAVEVVPTFVFLGPAEGSAAASDGPLVVRARVEGASPPEVAKAAAALAKAADAAAPDDAAGGGGGGGHGRGGAAGGGGGGAGGAPAAGSAAAAAAPLSERLPALIRSSPVMLFMKGTAAAPRCKFSRQMVELLHEAGAQFGTFDILQDEDVRQGLKEFSQWPTYPQLYVQGELLGGLDIVKELNASGDLAAELGLGLAAEEAAAAGAGGAAPPQSLDARIAALLGAHPVLLFMKGTPEAPQCGFSREMVGLLAAQGFAIAHVNILADDELRQGLKKYSNWPTYPQLYVQGELVGGLDIVKELAESGELAAMKPK